MIRDKIKIALSFLILLAVLSCSQINKKIEEKVYEHQQEYMRKVDSVIKSRYRDSITKNLDEQLKKLDSMKYQSDSTMKELEKSMEKLNNKKAKKSKTN
jgi:flagellar biosynthesis chaperone FliJ